MKVDLKGGVVVTDDSGNFKILLEGLDNKKVKFIIHKDKILMGKTQSNRDWSHADNTDILCSEVKTVKQLRDLITWLKTPDKSIRFDPCLKCGGEHEVVFDEDSAYHGYSSYYVKCKVCGMNTKSVSYSSKSDEYDETMAKLRMLWNWGYNEKH